MLVKARLYDHLRTASCGFPSGTEWGVPVRAPTPRFMWVVEDVNVDWQVVAVTPRYLDEMLYNTHRAIEVMGDGVDEQSRSLDDPEVDVVVLDHCSGNRPLLWALQIITACPYPLLKADEVYGLMTALGAMDKQLVGMRRNEYCVTMENFRRRFILVIESKAQTQNICRVEIPVAHLGRNRDMRDAEAVRMRPLLTAVLRAIIRSPQPLRIPMERWLQSRAGDTDVDWSTVDEIVS